MGYEINEANWNVHWRVTESAGLMVYLAHYRGRRVLWEGSMPYVTIDHQHQDLTLDDQGTSVHGPFWTPLGERCLASDVRTNLFRDGFEIAADFAAGPYRYTQLWRFHKDGRFSPWLTIYGAGIHDGHTYHPHWRFDFDINASLADALEYYEEGEWRRVVQEGWLPATGHQDEHGAVWRQVDRGGSGAIVNIRPHHWEDAELFASRYHDGEWAPLTPRSGTGHQPFPAAYVGAEPLDGEDITLWYVAHVHYDAAFPFTTGPSMSCSGF
jgi:hypothetical protein